MERLKEYFEARPERGTLEFDMAGRIFDMVMKHGDTAAHLLRIQYPEDMPAEQKPVWLMSVLLSDAWTNMELEDEAHRVKGVIEEGERIGAPYPAHMQDCMARTAIDAMPFWGGYGTSAAKSVFRRMVLIGSPEKMEKLRGDLDAVYEAIQDFCTKHAAPAAEPADKTAEAATE